MMQCRAVMFDLDGTLADTLADLAAAANHAFAEAGRPGHEVDRYRHLVGRGLDRLMRDGMPGADDKTVRRATAAFHEYYAAHRYDRTAAYAGIDALLDELSRRGLPMAVMSNKPDAATREMVAQVFGRWSFAAVRGHRSGYRVKPDPTAALEMAAEVGVEPSRWVYVGDTDVDMQTGRAAGFFTVGVTWGFRDRDELVGAGAEVLIDRPGELLTAIDQKTRGAMSASKT